IPCNFRRDINSERVLGGGGRSYLGLIPIEPLSQPVLEAIPDRRDSYEEASSQWPWPGISRTSTPRTLAAKRPSDRGAPASHARPPFFSRPLPAQNKASGNLPGK